MQASYVRNLTFGHASKFSLRKEVWNAGCASAVQYLWPASSTAALHCEPISNSSYSHCCHVLAGPIDAAVYPHSERERSRGDKEVWEAFDNHSIGVKENSHGLKVKFAFDTVFNANSNNKLVSHSEGLHLLFKSQSAKSVMLRC